jgi:hypothetical protein
MDEYCADINYTKCRTPYVKGKCPGGPGMHVPLGYYMLIIAFIAVQCCSDVEVATPGWTPGN